LARAAKNFSKEGETINTKNPRSWIFCIEEQKIVYLANLCLKLNFKRFSVGAASPLKFTLFKAGL